MSGIGDSTLPIVTPAPETVAPTPIINLIRALVAAQAIILPALKSTENTFFKSSYADLAEVWAVIRKPLTDNGLSVIQLPGWDKETARVTLRTILFHTSGESISSTLSLRPKEDTPQAIGSAYTYARRYALAAMVGVVQEDDDGQEASRPETEQRLPAKKDTPPVEHKPATPSNAPRPNEIATSGTQPGPTINVPRAHIPDALEEATGIAPSSVTPNSVTETPLDFPTKEEKKEFVRRMKLYSRGILPKAGFKGDPAEALKALILKMEGVSDTKNLTKTQWTSVLSALDAAHQTGGDKALLEMLTP